MPVSLNEPYPAGTRPRRVFLVVGGRLKGRARYRLGATLLVIAVAGRASLDLSEASFQDRAIRLTVVALGGSVEVLVPPGVDYQVRRLALGPTRVTVGAEIHRLPVHR